MKNYLLAVLLLLPLSLNAQQLNLPIEASSEVLYGTYLTADSAEVTVVADRVSIFAEGLDKESQPVAILKTPYVNGWVFIYDREKPFPPLTYILPSEIVISKAGVYDIQILPIVEGKASAPEFLEDIVLGAPEKPEDPEIPPVGNYDDLKKQAYDLAVQINDPAYLNRYLGNLTKIEFNDSLEQSKKKVAQARIDASRGGFTGQWYLLFQTLGPELEKSTTLEDYAARCKAVIAGLQKAAVIETNSIWLPPPGEYPDGFVYNGRVLETICDPSGCRRVWRSIKK